LGADGDAVIGMSTPSMVHYFNETLMRDPGNASAAAAYGGFLYQTAATMSGPQAQMQRDRGDMLLNQAIQARPAVGLVTRALFRAGAAADDPATTEAIDALWRLLDACNGAPLDRSTPNLAAYIAAGDTARIDPARCYASDRAPHNLEAIFVLMGDLLVKKGQLDSARTFYNAAQMVPSSAAWPYRAALTERLTGDLGARSASYRNADPQQWAPVLVAGRGCTICHSASVP
jgi:hypothetical protein